MATKLRRYLLLIVAALSFVFMPVAANAQYMQLSCDGNGGVATGSLYDQTAQTGVCQYSGINHIFSQIVCSFVGILNSVLGQMYCGIQYAITPTLAILLSLYIAVFGVQILMGTTQLNAKEVIIRLLKIAGVWTFATQSTWGLGIAFNFFIGGAAQMSMWVVNAISQSAVVNNVVLMPVNLPAATVGSSVNNLMPMYAFIDNLIYSAISGPFTQANDKVIGFFIVLMFFFPALFKIAAQWLFETIMLLADTLMNFLMSLSIIAFLIGMSSIFLSFMLFQSTAHLFEDWLKYMISYMLQVVIIFAIISLWIATMSLFGGFFTELSNLIWPYQRVDVTNVFSPDDTFGICQYTSGFGPPGGICPVNGIPAPCPGGINSCASYPSSPCLPFLVCKPNLDPGSANPLTAAKGLAALISPSQLLTKQDFIFFMMYNFIALTLISHLFSILLKEAPKIARQLSGPASVPALGGGPGMRGFGQIGGMGQSIAKGSVGKGGEGFLAQMKKKMEIRA